MSENKLYDNHGREINYLRLAVTDRCNLRCFYCMPEEGIEYVPRNELLTYEEMLRIVRIGTEMGITKLRITGGEPFVRKGMIDFLEELAEISGLKSLHLTTNGTNTRDIIPRLLKLGIKSINLSMDTLDRDRFFTITRRDVYDEVMSTFQALIESGIETKINAVVMNGKNIDDIIPFVHLTKDKPVAIRFIEEMPFNGTGMRADGLPWNHKRILDEIKREFPQIEKQDDPAFSTSANYQVPGFKGTVGIIAAYSRTFCGTCNRLRITPQGLLKTCLYDGGIFNIRDLMRQNASDEQVKAALVDAIGHRAKDGWEAESQQRDRPITESMSTIGG